MCKETKILPIQKEENMTKIQVNNNIYYHEVISKPNFYIIVIALCMWKQNHFETTFNSDNRLNIQYVILKGFGSR